MTGVSTVVPDEAIGSLARRGDAQLDLVESFVHDGRLGSFGTPRPCPLVASSTASASCGRAARFCRDEGPGSCARPLGAREGRAELLGHDASLEFFWWLLRAHLARASTSDYAASFALYDQASRARSCELGTPCALATRARALGFWMPRLCAGPCDCDACGHRRGGTGCASRSHP